MIEINLLPPEFQKRPKKDFKLPDLPYLRIFGVIILVFIGIEAILFGGVMMGRGNQAKWEKRLKALGPDFERIKVLKLDSSRSDADLKTLTRMMSRPFYWTALLNAVSDSLTDDVWLTYVGAERKTVEFDLPKKKGDKEAEEETAETKKGGAKPAPRKRVRRVYEAPKGKRIEDFLYIKGAAPVSGQGTAAVGRFIQSLKDNAVIDGVISSVKLDKIDRVNEETMYAFTIICRMKSEFGEVHETF